MTTAFEDMHCKEGNNEGSLTRIASVLFLATLMSDTNTQLSDSGRRIDVTNFLLVVVHIYISRLEDKWVGLMRH